MTHSNHKRNTPDEKSYVVGLTKEDAVELIQGFVDDLRAAVQDNCYPCILKTSIHATHLISSLSYNAHGELERMHDAIIQQLGDKGDQE
jgi:hypothetical protein